MILIIDDEPWTMEPYIRELRKNKMSYVIIDTLQGGLDFIYFHKEEIEIIILDMMMPLPDNYIDNGKYEGGLMAGLLVLEEVYQLDTQIPIIVLTNRTPAAIKQIVKAYDKLIIRESLDTPSFFLPQLIIDNKRKIEVNPLD